MMKPMLEICCGSFSDVKTAYENGADRVELNSALYMGRADTYTCQFNICKGELQYTGSGNGSSEGRRILLFG